MHDINILLIEDDHTLNEQLTELLRSKSYNVEQCFDGEQGLLRAASLQHQLILLDVMLPERDGFSLLKILLNIRLTIVQKNGIRIFILDKLTIVMNIF